MTYKQNDYQGQKWTQNNFCEKNTTLKCIENEISLNSFQ